VFFQVAMLVINPNHGEVIFLAENVSIAKRLLSCIIGY
jgi:hypothetical protein